MNINERVFMIMLPGNDPAGVQIKAQNESDAKTELEQARGRFPDAYLIEWKSIE